MAHDLESTPMLDAEKRERVGSRHSGRLRTAGRLPAVIYGHKQEPVAIHLDNKVVVRKLEEGDRLFRVKLNGSGQPELVLLRDLQFDHLGTRIIHADFSRVDIDERVEVTVKLEFVGDAIGLKKAGAVLVHPVTAIELECSVFNLPDVIEVDISALDLHDTLTAGAIKLPKDTMKLITDPGTVVVSITEQKGGADSDEASEVQAEPAPVKAKDKKE